MQNLQATLHLKLGRQLVDKGKFGADNTKISHKVNLANVYVILSSRDQQIMIWTLLALAYRSCTMLSRKTLESANGWTELTPTED